MGTVLDKLRIDTTALAEAKDVVAALLRMGFSEEEAAEIARSKGLGVWRMVR
jgi:hypothetical protein